jgi:hypothetical protein
VGVQVNVGEPSTVSAQAAGRILGVAPTGEHERRRIATLVHWGYGTGWGAARGLIGALGVRGSGATALFFAVVWCTELVTLPALDIGVAPVWPMVSRRDRHRRLSPRGLCHQHQPCLRVPRTPTRIDVTQTASKIAGEPRRR